VVSLNLAHPVYIGIQSHCPNVNSPDQRSERTKPRWGIAPLTLQLALQKLLQWSIAAYSVESLVLIVIDVKSLAGNNGYQLVPYVRRASWLLGRIGSGANRKLIVNPGHSHCCRVAVWRCFCKLLRWTEQCLSTRVLSVPSCLGWPREVIGYITTRVTIHFARGASYSAYNQLSLRKLNRSNAMTMSSKKSKVWLVTLDTNSPHIYLGQVPQVVLQVGRVYYWGELAVGRIDCKSWRLTSHCAGLHWTNSSSGCKYPVTPV